MKDLKVNVEKLEKVEVPCHGCWFATGVGVVATIIALT